MVCALIDVVEYGGRDRYFGIRRHADSTAPIVVVIEEKDIFFAVAVSSVFYALPSAICVFDGERDTSLHECALCELTFTHFVEGKLLESFFLEFVRVDFVLFHCFILSARLMVESPNQMFKWIRCVRERSGTEPIFGVSDSCQCSLFLSKDGIYWKAMSYIILLVIWSLNFWIRNPFRLSV